jgi:hypothetical protein
MNKYGWMQLKRERISDVVQNYMSLFRIISKVTFILLFQPFIRLLKIITMQNYGNLLMISLLSSILFYQCKEGGNGVTKAAGSAVVAAASVPDFKLPAVNPDNYWYQGKAELAAYDVEQERYGEMRQAEEVIIFVTEDLSKTKHIKLDNPAAAGTDRVPVLKTNVVRKFKTGIYDYSLMQSVFMPMDGSPTLKTTCTVQDWCGHVFGQFNLTGNNQWKTRHFSYFESEGDQESVVSADYLEDELINRLRLDPATLKTGKVTVVPSDFYLRMRHQPLQAASADLQVTPQGDQLTMTLRYVDIARTLQVTCENKAPWRITGWEETADGKQMSKGTLKAVRQEPYWSQHDNDDLGMRDSLRLKY